MTRHMAKFVRLLPLLALAACTANPATGEQSFTAFMSLEQELRVGAEEHPKILKEFHGEYGELKLRAYIRHIGKKLAAFSELLDLTYRFTILNDESVNAFALPGGYVYVTRGLLALAENEAEVAGVLAHEIGHITARHTAQRYSTATATNIGVQVLGVLGSAAGIPSAVGQAVSFGAQAALQSYSRHQELEADMLGVRYMTRAGYDPDATTSFFHKLGAHSKLEAQQKGTTKVKHNIMSTHPRTEDRIKQAIELAHTTPVARPNLGREAYLDQIDGMVFGDDPSQGVRRGRRFMHPKLRFEFRVPPSFLMLNSPARLEAFGPGKAKIVFSMAAKSKATRVGSLRDYLANDWGRGLNFGSVKQIEINGLEAATGQAHKATRDGLRHVRLVVIRIDREHIYQFAFVTPPAETQRLSEEFRRTTYSFRRLSALDAEAIRPLRIRLITVKPDDTRAKLAARIPFERYTREWFDLLNSLQPGNKLTPGTRIKIVAE